MAVVEVPPVTVLGENWRSTTEGGFTVRVALMVVPVALITIFREASTGAVLTMNVPDVLPSATVHDVTVAAVLLLDSATVNPPDGAGSPIVSVPVDGCPPTTEAGLRVMLFAAAVTMKSVELVPVPPELVTVILPVVAPEGTVAVMN